jgi:hypothetical protein
MQICERVHINHQFIYDIMPRPTGGKGLLNILGTRYCSIGSAFIGFALLAISQSAEAAKSFTTPQLKFLFEGSTVYATGGACISGGGGHTGETRFDVEFKRGGRFNIHSVCALRSERINDSRGTWRVSDDQICMESRDQTFNQTMREIGENCLSVKIGRFGFELVDDRGDRIWRIKIEKHPVHDSKEALIAGLRNIKPEVAAIAQPTSISAAASDSAAWEAIKYSNRISDFQRYLETYPNGLFVALAENQIRDLVKSQSNPSITTNEFADVNFGNYHALIIGINNYKYITKLGTAIRDAKAVAATLEGQYGFEVQTLIDPDRADIVDAFDEYRETLTNEDNLLIYYAGHGWLDEEAEEGYWLSAKAKSNRRSQWVSNATITKTLKTLPAKHVMVVADSCYSGTLTRAAAVGFRDKDYFKRMAGKKARVAMVSGGLEPVADDSGSGNSPFAKAFIDALSNNKDVIDGTRLFSQIRRPVILNAQQTPEYSDVRNANHDGGDFLFVRKN